VYELSILRKYLIPKKRQLSMTLVALMSVGVIALVVWLVVLFLSVTEGIEKTWLDKLTSLHAPLRVTPTAKYFSSYSYLADSASESSNYTPRSFAEKIAGVSDPYNPASDESLPSYCPPPEKVGDPVKIAHQILKEMNVPFQDFEMTGAMLRLQLTRGESHSFLTQASYLTSFPDRNPHLKKLTLPPVDNDVAELHFLKLSQGKLVLPLLPTQERGILVSKHFRDSGVRIGDKGWLAYPAATAGALQEQRLPIFVTGFYDPGVLSLGAKSILAPASIVHLINTSSQLEHFDKTAQMGFSVWLGKIEQAPQVAKELEKRLAQAGVGSYWKVTTYKEFDFAKDLLQQFQSDRYLFTLIGVIILLVACSNVISLLIILVNDKKQEIAILQALGATRKSLALIFGGLGASIGILSSLIGVGAAMLTLKNLDSLVHFLSFLQGQEMFNAVFYGNSLPQNLSLSALAFVLIATPLLSLIAGLIPAWKACRLSPSSTLRSL
jgi:lipoprotein-releasing system permease protein